MKLMKCAEQDSSLAKACRFQLAQLHPNLLRKAQQDMQRCVSEEAQRVAELATMTMEAESRSQAAGARVSPSGAAIDEFP